MTAAVILKEYFGLGNDFVGHGNALWVMEMHCGSWKRIVGHGNAVWFMEMRRLSCKMP